jgi:hypothetical protein
MSTNYEILSDQMSYGQMTNITFKGTIQTPKLSDNILDSIIYSVPSIPEYPASNNSAQCLRYNSK